MLISTEQRCLAFYGADVAELSLLKSLEQITVELEPLR